MNPTLTFEKEKLTQPPLNIHHLGDKVLRQDAKRVSHIDNETRALAKKMLQTMYSSNGIGLAAPQVAVNKQIIVIDCQPDKSVNPPLILINPVIKKFSRDLCIAEEGCLSIPNVFLEVARPRAIDVAFKDENGVPKKLKVTGLLARVIQHEMDHLKGVLFVDRVEDELTLNNELTKQGFSIQAVEHISEIRK